MSKWPLAIDFLHVYKNGCMLLWDPHKIADAQAHNEWLNKVAAPYVREGAPPSLSPITMYVVALPLLLLPPRQSLVAWSMACIVLGVLSILMIRRGDSPASKAGFCLLAFGCYPSFHTFWIGQFTWVYFSILALFYLSLRSQNRINMFFACAFATLKLQYFPFLISVLLRPEWRRTLAVLTVAGAAFLLIISTWVGPETLLQYPRFITLNDYQTSTMLSLRGVVTRIFGYDTGSIFSIFSVVLGLAGALYAWMRFGKDRVLLPWVLSLVILTSLVTSPHSYPYDCLFLMLMASMTLPGLSLVGLLEQPYWEQRVWSLILFFYPVISWTGFGVSVVGKSTALYAYFCLVQNVVMLTLVIAIVAKLSRQSKVAE